MSLSAPLSIRNLTGQAVTIVSVERFDETQTAARQEVGDKTSEADKANASSNDAASTSSGTSTFAAVSRVASNVWNATSSAITPASSTPNGASKDGPQSVGIEEINQQIESFGLLQTDRTWTKTQTLKFVLDVPESGRFELTIPSPKQHSNTLSPVDNAKGDYSTIYIKGQDSNTLTILSMPNLASWMTPLDSNLPISSLSLPGTHNSPTYYTALPSVRCQVVSPMAQLQNGIRFFDIRVQPPAPSDSTNTYLTLVHGVFPISLTGAKYFRDLVEDVKKFLNENPGETVICSVKREGVGEHTDAQLATLLRKEYFFSSDDTSNQNGLWFVEPRVPRLGEVRGKIVLMRRFGLDEESQSMYDGQGLGIDAANWAYNTRCDERGHIVVQDFCEVLETEQIEDKIGACCEFLSRSGGVVAAEGMSSTDASDVPRPIHLNFLSASNFWRVGCWPDKIAAKLNPAVLTHLCTKHVIEREGNGCTGIVVCDWVGSDGGDWDLVKCIVGMNGKIGVQAV